MWEENDTRKHGKRKRWNEIFMCQLVRRKRSSIKVWLNILTAEISLCHFMWKWLLICRKYLFWDFLSFFRFLFASLESKHVSEKCEGLKFQFQQRRRDICCVYEFSNSTQLRRYNLLLSDAQCEKLQRIFLYLHVDFFHSSESLSSPLNLVLFDTTLSKFFLNFPFFESS